LAQGKAKLPDRLQALPKLLAFWKVAAHTPPPPAGAFLVRRLPPAAADLKHGKALARHQLEMSGGHCARKCLCPAPEDLGNDE
jgi:hypothetical protein